jgi:hypothetical protein
VFTRKGFPITVAKSHPLNVPSTSFKAAAKMLSVAAIVMLDPLGAPPDQFMTRERQVVALCEFLLRSDEGEFDARDLAYLKRVCAATRAPRTRTARKPKAKS